MEKFINSLTLARLKKKKFDYNLFLNLDLNLIEAYKLQNMLNNRLMTEGLGKPSGYKIGCTTKIMQDYLKIKHPCSGVIFSNNIHLNKLNIKYNKNIKLGIECELAVKISKDIKNLNLLNDDQIFDCIESFHTSIEVVEDRFVNYKNTPTSFLIADNFFNHSLILGKPLIKWQNIDIGDLVGTLYINNKEFHTAKTSMILNNPINALKWLVKHLLSTNQYLKKDTFVSLGSIIKTIWIETKNVQYNFKLSKLGNCKVNFY